VKEFFPIIAITLVGLAIRCYTADWGSLSGDEANCVAIAVTGSWADMVQHIREDGNAPLYYALIRLFSQIFGSGDFPLRLINVLLSTSLVPVVYALLRKDRVLALQSALMVALCPTLVRWGNIVRMYSLLPVLSVVGTVCAVRLMQEPANKRLRIAHPFLAASLMYIHHWGFFVLFGQAGLALVGLIRRWWSVRSLVPWGIGMALAVVAYLPWVPSMYFILTHDESPWAKTPPPTYLFIETPLQMLIGDMSASNPWDEASMIYATIWVLFMVFYAGCAVARRSTDSSSSGEQAALVVDGTGWSRFKPSSARVTLTVACIRYVVLSGMLAAFLSSSFKPAWRDRYLMSFAPLVLLVLCLMLRRYVPSRNRLIIYCFPALLWLPVWTPEWLALAFGSESSTHEIVAKIKAEIHPSQDLVVVSYEAAAPAFSRMLPEDVKLISLPDLERVSIVKWAGINERLRDDSRMLELFERMKEVLDSGGVIWLVDAARTTPVTGQPGHFPVGGFDFRELMVVRMGQVRNWLQTHAEQQDVFLWGPGRDLSLFLSSYVAKPVQERDEPGSRPGSAQDSSPRE